MDVDVFDPAADTDTDRSLTQWWVPSGAVLFAKMA